MITRRNIVCGGSNRRRARGGTTIARRGQRGGEVRHDQGQRLGLLAWPAVLLKVLYVPAKHRRLRVDLQLAGGAQLHREFREMAGVLVKHLVSRGDNWKRRYDRLHLHDIIDECHLPYMQMPDNFPTFPTRVQYGNYLQAYQIALGINVLAQSTVSQVRMHPTTAALPAECRAVPPEVKSG